MFPLLFQFPAWLPLIGGRAIHTYGLMVATGFLLGMVWVGRESRRVGISYQKMLDLFFYIVVAAIIGSRILYVLISEPNWWLDPLVFIRIWEGGLVFYGGLIAAVLVSVFYCKKHNLSFFKVADIFSPGIALGHVFGRLGCFAAGCCYGKPSDSSLAVTFPQTTFSIAPFDHAVYPTQLFESAGNLLIFLFLFFMTRRKKFEGEVFLIYITLYSILRSIIEIYRGDQIRGFVIEGVISTSQFISLVWVVIAFLLWLSLRRKTKERL